MTTSLDFKSKDALCSATTRISTSRYVEVLMDIAYEWSATTSNHKALLSKCLNCKNPFVKWMKHQKKDNPVISSFLRMIIRRPNLAAEIYQEAMYSVYLEIE